MYVHIFNFSDILPLPGLTPEKYKVSLYCFRDFEPSKVAKGSRELLAKAVRQVY